MLLKQEEKNAVPNIIYIIKGKAVVPKYGIPEQLRILFIFLF